MLSPDFFQSLRANFIQYKPIEEKGRKRIKLDDSKQSSTSNSQNNVVMLYKNDLRTIDNPALYYASKYAQSNNGNVIGLFAFCEQELRVHNYGESKIALIAKSVDSLKKTLDTNFNIPLFIVEVEKAEKVPEAICTFCLDANASALFYNKQYELDESTRDSIVHDALTNIYGLNCFSFDDQCAVPPGTCTTQQGKQYAVFTPYKKCWLKTLQETNKKLLDMAPLPISNVKDALKSLKFSLEVINQIQFASKIADRYECNEKRVNQLANEFISKKATNYMKKRDFPALDGTSELSPYIALGMISIRNLINQAKQANNGNLSGGNEGLTCWVSELCWRDFYRNIVVAFPHVMKNQPFKLESKNIAWNNNQETFKRWTQGLTGYPIVDAGMRQLNATGWMHNRVRMITATFLVKDLLINWQWGEAYFSQTLIDCDFASNNGGWQWCASTGTDSQPYFRIFNPTLQGKRFDPDGVYIRKWVPELSTITCNKAIHNPQEELTAEQFNKLNYPTPIVNHSDARTKATAEFKRAFTLPK